MPRLHRPHVWPGDGLRLLWPRVFVLVLGHRVDPAELPRAEELTIALQPPKPPEADQPGDDAAASVVSDR